MVTVGVNQTGWVGNYTRSEYAILPNRGGDATPQQREPFKRKRVLLRYYLIIVFKGPMCLSLSASLAVADKLPLHGKPSCWRS